MKVIYKYPLHRNHIWITMPKNAQILSVINQNGIITVYALIDTDSETGEIEFYVFDTGWEIPADQVDELKKMNFIGTVQVENLVWHVFYKR